MCFYHGQLAAGQSCQTAHQRKLLRINRLAVHVAVLGVDKVAVERIHRQQDRTIEVSANSIS